MSIMLLKDYSVENRKDGYDRCGMTVPLIVRRGVHEVYSVSSICIHI